MSQSDHNKPPTTRVDVRILLPMFGILFSPFIGFLLSPDVGLTIAVISLGVMAWMTWSVSKQVEPAHARPLKIGAGMNAAMAVAALLLLLYRV